MDVQKDYTYVGPDKAHGKTRSGLTSYKINNIMENNRFASYLLTEALTTDSLKKSHLIIQKYLKRVTKRDVFSVPGMEKFKSTVGAGFGMRFLFPATNHCVRLNWHAAGGASTNNLHSIDIWNGKVAGSPTWHVEFDHDVSIVQVLPLIGDMLKNINSIKLGAVHSYPEGTDLEEVIKESWEGEETLTEAFDPSEAYAGVIKIIAEPDFTKGKIWSAYKSTGMRIFDEIERAYPQFLIKTGRSYEWKAKPADTVKVLNNREAILAAVGIVTGHVSKGAASETYSAPDIIAELEANRDRITFEQQLIDLENLVKMTISGAANALFVAGRGGVGKTHTVEKILQGMGYTDGNGYFKNTGSASAAGIYSLLFKHQKDIVFFDDSDDALGDQEARNLFKAATDTKKIRKLVWNKMGKNIVEPDDYADPAELIEQGLLPRYFNFTGKVIFISNLPLNKLDPDGALRTRAFIINIDPTTEEIYDFMDKIVDKIPLEDGLKLDLKTRKHCVELLRNAKNKDVANLRKLSRALNMQAGAIVSGVEVSDSELTRMIETYA